MYLTPDSILDLKYDINTREPLRCIHLTECIKIVIEIFCITKPGNDPIVHGRQKQRVHVAYSR